MLLKNLREWVPVAQANVGAATTRARVVRIIGGATSARYCIRLCDWNSFPQILQPQLGGPVSHLNANRILSMFFSRKCMVCAASAGGHVQFEPASCFYYYARQCCESACRRFSLQKEKLRPLNTTRAHSLVATRSAKSGKTAASAAAAAAAAAVDNASSSGSSSSSNRAREQQQQLLMYHMQAYQRPPLTRTMSS